MHTLAQKCYIYGGTWRHPDVYLVLGKPSPQNDRNVHGGGHHAQDDHSARIAYEEQRSEGVRQ